MSAGAPRARPPGAASECRGWRFVATLSIPYRGIGRAPPRQDEGHREQGRYPDQQVRDPRTCQRRAAPRLRQIAASERGIQQTAQHHDEPQGGGDQYGGAGHASRPPSKSGGDVLVVGGGGDPSQRDSGKCCRKHDRRQQPRTHPARATYRRPAERTGSSDRNGRPFEGSTDRGRVGRTGPWRVVEAPTADANARIGPRRSSPVTTAHNAAPEQRVVETRQPRPYRCLRVGRPPTRGRTERPVGHHPTGRRRRARRARSVRIGGPLWRGRDHRFGARSACRRRTDRRFRVRLPPARRAFCVAADERSGCSRSERAFWRGSRIRRRRGSTLLCVVKVLRAVLADQ
jgi:hypothetical protein